MRREVSLIFLILCDFICGSASVGGDCPERTRQHSTECNKYFKCIKLPNSNLKWITLTCQEGLIYDKNLRSCAIPDENWDCLLGSEEMNEFEKDDGNVYGVENLKPLAKGEGEDYRSVEDDDFLEVIDGEEILGSSGESRSGSDELIVDDSSNFSGDGTLVEHATRSSPTTLQMIATQVQRLTQLVQNHPKTNEDELTADDLNSYLDVYKIQAKPSAYHSGGSEKTAIPQNGKIHPEIMAEILNKQTQLNSEAYKKTTLSMDAIVPTARPMFYANKQPITEIQLKGGQGVDGAGGGHQIVVNRPVLFNVPSSEKSKEKEYKPYLSEDILKTILEISKQMVTQSNHNNNNNIKSSASNQENVQSSYHPIYYAIPFPVYSSPHNNIPNYYDHFINSSVVTTTTTQRPPVAVKTRRRKPSKSKLKNKVDGVQQLRVPQYSFNQQQQPVDYYGNYQQQNYPYYGPLNYYQQQQQQQYVENDRYPNQNFYNNRYGNSYGNSFYENRIVSDSSSPISYVDHFNSAPYRKETFTSPYSSDDSNNDDEYDALHDESVDSENGADDQFYDDDPPPPRDASDGLICSLGITRQANKTDCFKYYVCNSKTKEVFSYTCPSSTAFNDQTKFCDAQSYVACKKSQDRERGKLSNKKYFQEAHKALQQAKLESQKAERLASMVQKESQKIMRKKTTIEDDSAFEDEEEEDEEQSQEIFPSQKVRYRPAQITQKPTRAYVMTKRKKISSHSPASKSTIKRKKKKKVKCKSLGNIVDPEDNRSYWHCFKSPDNRMKRIHKKCTSNLVFCPETRFCSPSCR